MKVRAANLGDASGIMAIWNPIIRLTTATFTTEEKTLPGTQSLIETAACALVAENDSGVRGFAISAPFRAGAGYVHTEEVTVYVAPEVRETGIGRQLLAALEENAAARGVTRLIVGVSGENVDAPDFFRRFGFAETARLPKVGFKFDREIDLIFMMKSLT